jgi:uncharacterized protein
VLLCDTSGLIAYFDASDGYHADVSAAIDEEPGPFAVSPYVLAEVDCLLATRRGVREELLAVRELSGSAWELPAFDPGDVRQADDIVERYAHQNIGLADASLVILAARYRTDRLLTLDHRHYRVIRTASGKPFTLVP